MYGDSAGIPGMKKEISYLVFAGTSEGRQLAEFFQKNQLEIFVIIFSKKSCKKKIVLPW